MERLLPFLIAGAFYCNSVRTIQRTLVTDIGVVCTIRRSAV